MFVAPRSFAPQPPATDTTRHQHQCLVHLLPRSMTPKRGKFERRSPPRTRGRRDTRKLDRPGRSSSHRAHATRMDATMARSFPLTSCYDSPRSRPVPRSSRSAYPSSERSPLCRPHDAQLRAAAQLELRQPLLTHTSDEASAEPIEFRDARTRCLHPTRRLRRRRYPSTASSPACSQAAPM